MCACNANFVLCFILDNNAYIILGSQIEYTGRFIGDVSPIITHQLIRNGVYKRIEMYDYQAICQKPPEAKKKNAGTRVVTFVRTVLSNLLITYNRFFVILAARKFATHNRLGVCYNFAALVFSDRRSGVPKRQK